MNKEEIINAVVTACRASEGGTLKFGNGGFVDFTVSWDYRANFDLHILKTDMHIFNSTLDSAVKAIEKYALS